MSSINKFEVADECIAAAREKAQTDKMRTRIDDMQVHGGNVEPGYPDDVCVTGDFNPIGDDKASQELYGELSQNGIEGYWHDEWRVCDVCQKIFRTSGNGWDWRCSFVFLEDSMEHVCKDCLLADKDKLVAYVESLEGDKDRAITFDVDLVGLGYVQIAQGLERGMRHGQDADPAVIKKALERRGIHLVVFSLDEMDQFHGTFSVYVKSEELIECDDELELDAKETQGASVSEALQRGLSKVAALPPVEEGKVRLATIDVDGVVVREMTQQEFIQGSPLSDIGKEVPPC